MHTFQCSGLASVVAAYQQNAWMGPSSWIEDSKACSIVQPKLRFHWIKHSRTQRRGIFIFDFATKLA
jgi:hypothetical protein